MATHNSWLEIDLSRLDTNLAALRSVIGSGQEGPASAQPAQVCAVIKADAYGLGAVQIAKRLVTHGVEMLAVYSPDQGRDLVTHGVDHPILFLMPVRGIPKDDPLAKAASRGRLHLTIHDPQQLQQVQQTGQDLGCAIPIHLFIDTGMSRSGLSCQQASRLLRRVADDDRVRLAGVLTHLATANDDPVYARVQADRFDRFLDDHQPWIGRDVRIHLANTAATLRGGFFHRSMVRVGLGVLGYGDDLLQGDPRDFKLAKARILQPVVRWLARINHIQRYPRGTNVGYACTHELKRDSVLGVVPAGHADGYPWSLGNRSGVHVIGRDGRAGFEAPVIGQVSMDQMVVDLTEGLAGERVSETDAVRVGDVVELISNDPRSPCSLPRLATLAGTCCYEMLCRLSPRLPRCYLGTAMTSTHRPLRDGANENYPLAIKQNSLERVGEG